MRTALLPHRVTPLSLLLVLCACTGTWEPEPELPETVEYDTVRVEYGSDDALTEAGMMTLEQKLVGDPSRIAQLTRASTARTNLTLRKIFDRTAEITALARPHATYDDASQTWTLVSEREAEYARLLVSQRQPPAGSDEPLIDVVEYKLFLGRSAQDNQLVYQGEFYRVARRDGAQQGYGILRFDFDAWQRYDASAPSGQMRLAFRARNGVRQVDAVLFDATLVEDTGEEKQRLNARLSYESLPQGEGRMRFFTRDDLTGDARRELIAINALWTADRRGYAATSASAGSLGPVELMQRQCWDAQGITTYVRTNPQNSERDGGELSDCAPELRDLEISPPVYSRPALIDPPIPTRHPEERGS